MDDSDCQGLVAIHSRLQTLRSNPRLCPTRDHGTTFDQLGQAELTPALGHSGSSFHSGAPYLHRYLVLPSFTSSSA